jgi:Amino acid synthesis
VIEVRRVFTHVEDIFHEFGPLPPKPLRRGAIAAVVRNPFAGRFEPNILPYMDALRPVGLDLAHRLIGALGISPSAVTGYGKAAIVGASGEIEHGALWHVPGGYGMRELLGWKSDHAHDGGSPGGLGQPGNALAIVASSKKVGAPGVTIDVPLTHINASYVRGFLDAIEVRIPGAPLSDEIAFILAMSTGPRIHDRLGGLRVEQISRWDGQR